MSVQIYVGTYAKYNNGSINGAWIDLELFSDDEESFLKACKELHSDEVDPEFMYQDFEGFPREFYSESSIDSRLFTWLALDDDDRDRLTAFLDCFGDCAGDVFEAAENAYYGNAASDYDFAVELLESTGDISTIPNHLQNYFDYDKYARDLMLDFSSSNEFYFSSNW